MMVIALGGSFATIPAYEVLVRIAGYEQFWAKNIRIVLVAN